MTRALWLMAVALPLAAQPKLLINAQVDTRSAAAGLEREFRALLSTQPQPSWIAYTVPAMRNYNLGCEYVSPGGHTVPGVVHLEPPDHAVILLRLESGAVNRLRALSPDCEIDAGGVPMHWLNDVRPAESVALLGTLDFNEKLMAIAMHADPAADAALERLAAAGQPESIRRHAAFWIGAARGRRGVDFLRNLLATDPSRQVRERAVEGLAANREPEALDVLISIARKDGDTQVRQQAVSAIGRSRDPKAHAFLEGVLK
ncbi:MAG TPA: HEAT repeat domain-containing protein [Bryobacteraceae bacterium]|nr:HEAT repeat domain-containing protein [Bryobacteraceae bacterium]